MTMTTELTTVYLPGNGIDLLSTYDYGYVDHTSTTLTDFFTTENYKYTTLFPTENEYFPAIPAQDVKIFSHITRSFINPCLGIVGFVGNILGVGVLWRQARKQKLSIFWYLCALTIADVMF